MMGTDTEAIQSKADEAYAYFQWAKRSDGESYYRLMDGSPEWVSDLVREAHDGLAGLMLPDDWRYDCIHSALAFISESGDPDDGASEFADQQVDVYNAARTAWLESSLYRASYCDEALAEFGPVDQDQGVFGLIGIGQYMEASEVYASVLQSLENAAENDEAENDETDEADDD